MYNDAPAYHELAAGYVTMAELIEIAPINSAVDLLDAYYTLISM